MDKVKNPKLTKHLSLRHLVADVDVCIPSDIAPRQWCRGRRGPQVGTESRRRGSTRCKRYKAKGKNARTLYISLVISLSQLPLHTLYT